jgi:methylglutaconyl-CoA hydratase
MSKPHHSYSTLTIGYEGAVATVTLNRPEKRNAITYTLMDDLMRALEEVEQSPAQVLILTGSGKAFCAGMDIEDLHKVATLTPEASHADSLRTTRLLRTLFVSLYKFPKVTIAAVNGPAIAGGCGLATLCDFTIAATEAKFGYTEVRIGFIPALVSTFLLRQVGEKQARDLLLTGRVFGADEAFRLGLVTEVVAGDKLMERVHELAETLLKNCPTSLQATKRLLRTYAGEELDRELIAAVEENVRIRTTRDFHEGVTSFLEKRDPKWTGQ